MRNMSSRATLPTVLTFSLSALGLEGLSLSDLSAPLG
jgi:hypothetical protein